jgi:hypothetical protein
MELKHEELGMTETGGTTAEGPEGTQTEGEKKGTRAEENTRNRD